MRTNEEKYLKHRKNQKFWLYVVAIVVVAAALFFCLVI